jgi:hypothetical protein
MRPVSRDELAARLRSKGHSTESINRALGDPENPGQFFQVDEAKRIVMGECDHHYEVDEPGDAIRHVVCTKCGYGKFTNLQVDHGKLKSL